MYQTKKHKNHGLKMLLRQCWTNRTQFAVPIILLCALGILILASTTEENPLRHTSQDHTNQPPPDYQEAPDECSGEFSDGSYTYQTPNQEILDRYARFAE